MKRLALSLLTAGIVAIVLVSPATSFAVARSADPAVPAAKTAGALPGTPRHPVLGADLYALGNYSSAVVQADGARTLQYIKTDLKASAVAIVWNFYAASAKSSAVETTSNTLSAANVAILTQIAEQDGLSVEYRPLIFINHAPGRAWEGNISPASPARWFSSYYKAELPYLRVAAQWRVPEFVVETEMHALNRNSGWSGFFKRLASVYKGALSYAAWEGDYFPPSSHLLDAKALGMDMYEPMPQLSASASKAKVLAGWESWFKTVPSSVLERTTIQETGIEARSGAYADPANLNGQGKLDQQVQAYWFSAACSTVHKYHMAGVFFWKVDLTDYPAHPASSLSTFEGRKGALAIAACAAILS